MHSVRVGQVSIMPLGLFLGALIALLAAPLPRVAAAQQERPIMPIWDGAGLMPSELNNPPSKFQLAGLADLGAAGMRRRGTMQFRVTNDGTADYYFVLGSSVWTQLNTPNGTSQMTFPASIWAGAPRSEWEKHRVAVPSLNNAIGGGWTSEWNLNAFFLTFPNMWRGADGQLGLVHSGTSNTDDGTCTDFTSDFVDAGTPLLAVSDCPATWGAEQFAGARRLIPFERWVDYFNQVGSGAFSWDWWRVPPEFVSEELTGDFQTYGKIVDWAADNLTRFGNVIPGGSGPPTARGWPLGLSVAFDAFSFQLPDVANTVYWQGLIINESEQVYGPPGLDYDSLYFGQQTSWLISASGASQTPATYYRPELGGVLVNTNGTNPACNGALTPTGVFACRFPVGGFSGGAAAVIILKSPLGDLRNKALSDSTSPFFDSSLGHPDIPDTLTFNLGRISSFGCWSTSTNRSARSGFGLYAGIMADFLDGRVESDLAANTWFECVRNFDFPAARSHWNRYVPPGNWDYDGDGVLDTLKLDSCIGNVPEFPATGGCSVAWSDTLPGKLNNARGNIAGLVGFGPFALAAGDTAPITMAFVSGASRADLEANVRNAIGGYQRSFLFPKPAPPPRIVSVSTGAGDRGRDGGASVSLFLDDGPEVFEDVFMLLQASQIQGSQLDTDNPWLVDSIRAVARANVGAIHVFKSCDLGNTFTSDNNCFGDPAEDAQGNSVGLGWQAFATFEPDEDGRFPNVFTDGDVTAGKTYVYSFVSETRGLTVSVVGRDDENNPIAQELTIAPSLFNPLSTSATDPNVARVYVPASGQAGSRPANVEVIADDPVATAAFHPVGVSLTGEIATTADYRLVFGDSAIVTVVRDRETGEAESSRVELYRTVITSLDGGANLTRLVYDADTFTTTNPSGVDVAGGVTSETIDNGTTTETTVYGDTLTLVVVDGTDRPLFASSLLDGSNATPGSFFGRSDFPRFILQVDNTDAGSFEGSIWLEEVAPDSFVAVRALGSPSLTWLQSLAVPSGEGFGVLSFEFVDAEFGPSRTFVLDFSNPANTEAALAASLDARVEGTQTSTAPEVAAALGVDPSDLIEVTMPFTVSHAAPVRDVTVAMLATAKLPSIVLGTGLDQITVDVPAEHWVPGEVFAILETIRTFQRATGAGGEYVVTSGGQPVLVDTLLVTWSSAVLGCSPRVSCNPVRGGTRGADAASHLAVTPDVQSLNVLYLNPMTPTTAYEFRINRTLTGDQVTSVTAQDLDQIRVVPNPYVVFSLYEQEIGDRRLMFMGLPPRGTINIYTVSGQFVQRITYDEQDLVGNGDLYWNMRTRENTDIATGLYVFVLQGTLPASGQRVQKLGKFVVIR